MNCLAWFLLLLLIFIRKSTVNGEDNNSTTLKRKICEAEACQLAAAAILNSMNKTVDPCEDFYSFVCDGWMQQEHLDSNVFKSIRTEVVLDIIKLMEEIQEDDSLTDIERKIITIFNTCTKYEEFDEETVKWFEDLFESIGGFPMLSPEWEEENYNWLEGIAQLSLKLNFEPLILIDSKIDNRNSSRNILMVSQPSRGEAVKIENVALYPFFFDKARGRETKINIGDATFMDIIKLNIFQAKLNSVTKYGEDFEDMQKFDSTMTVKDLQNLIPKIDWLTFLRRATGDILPVEEGDYIVVRGKDYLVNLIGMIDNGTISKRTIANFLGYNALVKTMELFPVPLVHLIKNFSPDNLKRSAIDINEVENHRTLTVEEARKIVCLWPVVLPLNFAIDHMYITRRKQQPSKLNKIVKNLSISLKQILKSQTWIDKDSKKFYLEKQKEMAVLYDYPNWIIDPTNIEKFYRDLPEPSSNALENFSMVMQFARKLSLLFTSHQNNRLKWPPIAGLSASYLNAYYLKNFNTIILPYALKHPSVYHQQRPSYLNYGAVGVIIGHEMGHGFDKDNIQRDKYGVLRNWTNENFKKQYLNRTQCLIAQYSNFTLNEWGNQLNGKKTISQNIADLIGLKISYRAFKREDRLRGPEPLLAGLEEYTTEQLFFITFGTNWCETKDATQDYWKKDKSDHSPSKFRILGTVTNMKEFSKAFKCKRGTKMNPVNKCAIL